MSVAPLFSITTALGVREDGGHCTSVWTLPSEIRGPVIVHDKPADPGQTESPLRDETRGVSEGRTITLCSLFLPSHRKPGLNPDA